MALFNSPEELVRTAENMAQKLRYVKTHSLRRIYSRVQSIYQQSERSDFNSVRPQLILLKPQLAFMANRKSELKPLTAQLTELINRTNNKEHIKEIYQFVQSVVAYHKE